MFKTRELLFFWILRFPFFLVVYTCMFLLVQDGSALLFFTLVAVFTLICVLDALIKAKVLLALTCAIIAAAMFAMGAQSLAIMVIFSAIYRPVTYTPMINFLWIGCLCVSMLAVEFIDPSLSHICLRNILAASVATLLTRQMQTLDRFLSSYYCWGISRKTAIAMVRRVYKLTVLSLGIIAIAGFLAARTDSPGSGTRETIPELAGDFADFVGTILVDLGVAAPPDDVPEGAPPPLEMEEMVSLAQTITFIVMYVVLGVSLVLLVIFLIYNIQKRAALQFEDFDEDIEEGDALQEGLSEHRRKTRLKLGPNRTIRRLFRLKVLEHMNESGLYPLRSDTPDELSEKIAQWEDVDSLKNLYHKARYSATSVSKAELNEYYAQRKGN